MEGKQKITEEKQSKKDEIIRNVNVYGNDDDEVEEVMIQIPKKRKGPMDAFVAPIDVDFRPRVPNSNENKKALENIHGYIADFFYENSISFNCARSDSYSKMMQAIVQYNDSSNEIESNTKLKEGLLDCIAKLALDEEDESQILRDLIAYRTKAGRLGKRGAQACVKTIAPVPDDARDDIVLGTDMTYGVLEDAEDGFDDPPLTRTSRTNTASHCSQEVASSSRSTTRHLQDSSDDDDYDVDANYGMGDGDDDGIDSGSDEDI
ncbi:hypothetical protein GIB67_018688 [Kingdonia uniflora]|uniref:Uncharacterized protein n=1 Tax=Kingdonia uniflora TaxID=39325 RepID=A0A7J7L241_9MAGN|nr:hypothetical protein GIB67_018688 [Kingdonia uniflora]